VTECRESRKSESGCSDEIISRGATIENTMYESVPYLELEEHPRKLWYRTVHEYSGMQLTFEKDKMAALAALTQKMETLRVDDRFLAGLWEKTLLLDLLWMMWPSPNTGRSATWRAPTWSWTSVRSQVMWDNNVDSVLSSVQVADIGYTTVGPAHMGDIGEAVITLRAPLIRATIENGRVCLNPTTPSLGQIAIYDQKEDYVFSMPGQHQVLSGTEVAIVPIGIGRSNNCHIGIVLLSRQGTLLYERVACIGLIHRDIKVMLKKGIRFEMDASDAEKANLGLVNSILTNLTLKNVIIV
jgi:hypothetical protein